MQHQNSSHRYDQTIGTGALLAGRDVQLNLSADATNSGTIAGRNLVQINANNIKNLGGNVSGAAVALLAEQDINNIGGQIQCHVRVSATLSLLEFKPHFFKPQPLWAGF
ncbi:hypothetical protein [Limnohabitans sp. T6-20]|uniref:hypothetical protein n=1 Tax=Limnohabitans sp. T6-20 TaxID=1100725 RepID=UPI000D35AA15|nr:hypothetical protein [Limnohabitans sp. T6-20]PUE12945.1 hypothetical protein B9Z33_05555 [Limnohabitans sp. T6-20]